MKISDLPPVRYYLATPYSKYPQGLEAAYEEACRLSGEFVRAKKAVYCPIAHTHGIAKHGKLDPYDTGWYLFDEPEILLSGGLVVAMMEGFEVSRGVNQEIVYAKSLGLPLYTLDPKTSEITSVAFSDV